MSNTTKRVPLTFNRFSTKMKELVAEAAVRLIINDMEILDISITQDGQVSVTVTVPKKKVVTALRLTDVFDYRAPKDDAPPTKETDYHE